LPQICLVECFRFGPHHNEKYKLTHQISTRRLRSHNGKRAAFYIKAVHYIIQMYGMLLVTYNYHSILLQILSTIRRERLVNCTRYDGYDSLTIFEFIL